MNSLFEVQIGFEITASESMHSLPNLIHRHIRLHRWHCIYDKKTPVTLHKNSLFLESYIISNVLVMENYKWCFKKQFLSLIKYKYRPHI